MWFLVRFSVRNDGRSDAVYGQGLRLVEGDSIEEVEKEIERSYLKALLLGSNVVVSTDKAEEIIVKYQEQIEKALENSVRSDVHISISHDEMRALVDGTRIEWHTPGRAPQEMAFWHLGNSSFGGSCAVYELTPDQLEFMQTLMPEGQFGDIFNPDPCGLVDGKLIDLSIDF